MKKSVQPPPPTDVAMQPPIPVPEEPKEEMLKDSDAISAALQAMEVILN